VRPKRGNRSRCGGLKSVEGGPEVVATAQCRSVDLEKTAAFPVRSERGVVVARFRLL
jgi:hypothetical protein